MAVIAIQDQILSNWLKMEDYADLAYCRDLVSFTGAAGVVKTGTVLGKKTAGGFALWNKGASDGSEVAAAIVFNTFTATGTAQNILALKRGPASVSKMGLLVPAGTDAAAYTQLKANLEAIGVQVLETVDTEQ